MPPVSRLHRLREWLRVPEAAQYLAVVFGESVSEADVLRLALDRHLTLSVRFPNHVRAKLALPPLSPTQLGVLVERMARIRSRRATPSSRKRTANDKHDRVVTLQDTEVYDLPLVGGERLDVEQEYQRLTDGPAIELIAIDGTFVERNNHRYQIQDQIHIHSVATDIPAARLPTDCVLVIRRSALDEFVTMATGQKADKPLGTRERDTLSHIIWALCHLAKLPVRQVSKTAGIIAAATVERGTPVAPRTIESHLKRISDAFGER